MKKAWWTYLDKPAYVGIFGGIFLLGRNATIGITIIAIGFLLGIIYFFMSQKNA